ncbi:FMN-dependent NADH-azoreductase [Noviherbaspirillum denitrificans]|uniref:FMN dependent NADH:quinone oxidoreductase n=1 Tax=Noviherbaspirillum denitrificans TaxID=1968433 RepID=A0A254TA81_9BURK|nr:NAD(P)H-dependent oxidoreductase [Noviherbaspirillum denitrificans]OWW19556.1 FMN-dependent NADH-azoreductase [Noviherbaspirillum denitrificans]
MKTLLQLNTSLFADNSQSNRLSNEFVAAWRDANPDGKVIVRDVAAEPIPHLDGQRFGAFLSKPEDRTAQQQAVVDFSDTLIEELRNADVIALGLPMYNFGIPSVLKAYFDHIARAGVTFKYTETGPVGLLTGKKVYVFATRGGKYLGTPADTQTGYVRDFLRFIGMSDVEFVYAEGLAMGDESKTAALAKADEVIRELAAPLREAA